MAALFMAEPQTDTAGVVARGSKVPEGGPDWSFQLRFGKGRKPMSAVGTS